MKLRQTLVLFLLAAAAAQTSVSSAYAFGKTNDGISIHDQIIKDALYDSVCAGNIDVIMQGCRSQDDAGSEGATEPRRHFGDGKLSPSLGYVDREKRKILHYAEQADSDEKARVRVLYHFGQMVHTLQDFYSRSNYLELLLARNPRWEHDPYSMDLPDWSELEAQFERAPRSKLAFNEMDKSLPSTAEGKKPLGDTTYFKAARGLAVRETQRQWNLLETMIKNNLGTRGANVIQALRSATCSPKVVKAVLDNDKPDLVPEI